jgi:hypothetical protein
MLSFCEASKYPMLKPFHRLDLYVITSNLDVNTYKSKHLREKDTCYMANSLFTPTNLGVSTTGLLIFLVLTSKNIIIFNEEILVLISFIAFFVTCQKNLQDSVTEAFQTRCVFIANLPMMSRRVKGLFQSLWCESECNEP